MILSRALCGAFLLAAVAAAARAEDKKAVDLFNGKNLEGWVWVPREPGSKIDDVWSVKEGVLICKGKPPGYIRTEKDYTSYIITLEWRFDPAKGAGNSGVLLRCIGEDKVWPKSIEAQLHSGNAGDFWNIDGFKMTVDPARTKGRRTIKLTGEKESAEKPLGEWNQYEITVDKGTIKLKVNGKLQNEATDVEVVAGKIALQSEGAEIQFRNVKLTPIE
ncbi:MAG: DUF1080 domain-containing protein [Planctomycetia bacterium]|nr:DUF1080 domain-containing protein [Planctomycetia bacterium]